MSSRGDRGRGRGEQRGRGEAGPNRGRGFPPRGTAGPSQGGPAGRGGDFRGRGGPRGGPGPGRGGHEEAAAQVQTQTHQPQFNRQLKHEARRMPELDQSSKGWRRFGTAGQAIAVRANFFALKFAKNLIIHEYRITYTPSTDIKRIKGRILECVERMPQFAQYRPHVAHDRSERLVSAKVLPKPLALDVTFIEEGETTPAPNAKKYRVELEKTGELDTNDLAKHVDGDPANRDIDIGPLVSAINLIVQANAARNGTKVGGNRHFFGPAQWNLGGGVEAWRGYFASVRPIWKTLAVNINVCMTAFIEEKNMAVAIMEFQSGSYGATPHLGAMFGKSTLRVKTVHLGHRKAVRAIFGKSADQHSFYCEEFKKEVTVAQYFARKYPNHPLRYPDLPLLNIGGPNKVVYVPAEMCNIVSGLPFRGRLGDTQTAEMLRAALKTPVENSNLIRGDGFAKLGLATSNLHETMKNFGLSVDQEMAVVPARILPPPGLSYKKGRAAPRDGSWNLNEVQFHRGGAVGRLAVLVVREQGRDVFQGPDDPEMWNFITAFAQKCRAVGMTVAQDRPLVIPTAPLPRPSPQDPSRTAAMREIKTKMTQILTTNPQQSFILVLLNARDNYIYPGLKRIGDVELGVQTVCMQLDKAIPRPDNRDSPADQARKKQQKQDQYFSNVALKVNTKLGGINHKLDAKDLKWLQEKRTMVVGADVTHPGPTSAEGTPSLAAVVANIDSDFVQFPGSLELQTSRQEMIQDFTKMMVERLLLYRERSKALPDRVIFFRDGVSEGQFDKVLVEELPQMLKAFEKVYTGKGQERPKVTICICGKRHHARFYPVDSKDATKNGNTKPGTIVDKGIGDVYRFDFYLQAHAGLQGTVKATHYTVVYDEIGFSADAIQQGTHSSSYSYVRATKAVSLVPPAYYADLACERGRLYLNDLFNLGAEKASSVGSVKRDKEAAKQEVYKTCVDAWGEGIHRNVKDTMFYV